MPGLIVDFPRHLQNSDITSDINRASNINRVKKRVDFSPMSELCYFEREVNDLDKREIWYTKTELKDFQADNKRAVYEFQLRSIALSSSQSCNTLHLNFRDRWPEDEDDEYDAVFFSATTSFMIGRLKLTRSCSNNHLVYSLVEGDSCFTRFCWCLLLIHMVEFPRGQQFYFDG